MNFRNLLVDGWLLSMHPTDFGLVVVGQFKIQPQAEHFSAFVYIDSRGYVSLLSPTTPDVICNSWGLDGSTRAPGPLVVWKKGSVSGFEPATSCGLRRVPLAGNGRGQVFAGTYNSRLEVDVVVKMEQSGNQVIVLTDLEGWKSANFPENVGAIHSCQLLILDEALPDNTVGFLTIRNQQNVVWVFAFDLDLQLQMLMGERLGAHSSAITPRCCSPYIVRWLDRLVVNCGRTLHIWRLPGREYSSVEIANKSDAKGQTEGDVVLEVTSLWSHGNALLIATSGDKCHVHYLTSSLLGEVVVRPLATAIALPQTMTRISVMVVWNGSLIVAGPTGTGNQQWIYNLGPVPELA